MRGRIKYCDASDGGSTLGIIYARYSSHNQKEESIEQQVDECMAFAKANNIEIIHVYADMGHIY